MIIHELNNPIDIHCPKGKGKCIAWIDYGIEVNSIWKVRLHESGKVINVYDSDILIYPNFMNAEPQIQIPKEWVQ